MENGPSYWAGAKFAERRGAVSSVLFRSAKWAIGDRTLNHTPVDNLAHEELSVLVDPHRGAKIEVLTLLFGRAHRIVGGR
jgi:hypothetical protein